MKLDVLLHLENGTTFSGKSETKIPPVGGEVVFTTGMTGYVETLTDPSYAGQIIVFTFPLIGNYGVPKVSEWESKKVHAKAVIVSELCEQGSHFSLQKNLKEFLNKQNVPLVTEFDTRALTLTLREHGAMNAVLSTSKSISKNLFSSSNNWVAEVSSPFVQVHGNGAKTVILVDCGVKQNILRSLLQFPLTVKQVPFDYDYAEEDFDGVVLSNGPGDPVLLQKTIACLKKAMTKQRPILGICLGSQLLALAAGAKTYKLRYGHRGQNQPCREESTGRCIMTSQNHGYAVDGETLPSDWYVNFRNMNDGSVEGVAHSRLPFFSAQFHPEACPGPTDAQDLFTKFYSLL